MTRNEVLEVMKAIKNLKPYYFDHMSKEKKLELVDEWTSSLSPYDYNSILKITIDFINDKDMVPYPREIIDKLETFEWMKYIQKDGDRYIYGENLINYIGFRIWDDVIPKDILDRLDYDPSMNTPEQEAERQEILKMILAMQEESRNGTDSIYQSNE